MKEYKKVKQVAGSPNDPNRNIYTIENGLHVWDVQIDAGLGEEVTIGHVSDLHLNYCNQQDFDEADPVIMSTYEHRMWLKDAESVPNVKRCLAFLEDMDQVVANGDVLDYLSHGTREKMDEVVWGPYPEILVSVGGHELSRKMQGKVEDTMSEEDVEAILQAYWRHDIYYASKVVKDKVLVIAMLNDNARYRDCQEEKLKADLNLAREKGYAVLIFAHEPLRTNNPKEADITVDDVLTVGDPNGLYLDMYHGMTKSGGRITGGDQCDDVTKRIYNMIISSADVVKGIFAGHWHNDMFFEIHGSMPDGTPAIIPHYVHTASAYDEGHVMRIAIR